MSRDLIPPRIGTYLVERRSDQGYNSDQDLAEEVVPAVDTHHHSHIVVGFDDHTGTVKVGTSKLPADIRNPSGL